MRSSSTLAVLVISLELVKAFVTLNQSFKFSTYHHHHHSSSADEAKIESKNEKIAITDESINRRNFLLTASSVVTAASILSSKDPVKALETINTSPNDDISILSTTPSISEGELTLSDPPPNREKIIIVDTNQSQQKPTGGSKKLIGTDPRFFIAGGISAAVSHGITTPIDVVKTKMQANSDLNNLGLQKATLAIIENDGPKALLGGLGPTVVGYGIEGALKFGVYESLKPIFTFLFFGNAAFDDPAKPYLAAAVCAGALASIILCPMEETRIRLVTDPTFDSKGLLDGLPRLIQEEGIFSTFSGLGAMLSKQVPYTMASFNFK